MTTQNTPATLELENIDCSDCASALERQVREIPGVANVRVNVLASRLSFEHTGQLKQVRHLVTQRGYLKREEQVSFWLQPTTFTTLVAGLLAFASLWFSPSVSRWLLVGTVLSGGFYPSKKGLATLIFQRNFDINFLMMVAVSGALAIGELGEAAVVVFLFALSHNLETYTLGKARSSIRSLMKLAPDVALLVTPGGVEQVATVQLVVGDKVMVLPGDRIPVDGHVIEGVSEVNLAPVTGEALPVRAQLGTSVYAGAINGTGQLKIEVNQPPANSTLARIVCLVEDAAASKAPIQQFVDQFARWYTPLVLIIAVGVVTLPPLVLSEPLGPWLYRGLALLVVSCPCALVISTPVSIVSALANAARRGVLIKNGAVLEEAARTAIIALDKTGTITGGEPKVAWLKDLRENNADSLLALAAAVESGASHPLARAIQEKAKFEGNVLPESSGHRTLPGVGATAIVNDQQVYAVNEAYLPQLNIQAASPDWTGTLVALAVPGRLLGWLGFHDHLRPQATETVQNLYALGVTPVMLTGDNKATAKEIADAAGIVQYEADLLPEGKLAWIHKLKEQGSVMMVGDGINDAPALAVANTGVAMGGIGSDIALEAASMALMSDDISRLPFIIRLSRKALATIRVNMGFAITVKLLALLLILPGWLTLWLAILADTGAALLVILNGMRLLRTK